MTPAAHDPTKRNVLVLAACQALSMSMLALLMTISAIVGSTLTDDPALVTLPLALQFLAMMLATVPASLLMGRFGRRFGFTLGAACGLVGGLVGAYAVVAGSFALLGLAGVLFGIASAHAMYYRFAAADTASEAFKPKAISLVLAGGIVAAVAGPEIAKQTRDLFQPLLFVGTYLAVSGLCAAVLVLLRFIDIPRPRAGGHAGNGRPLLEILRQPRFLVAVLAGMVGYGAMNLIMVATPLAMTDRLHPFESAATVIQLHVLGMYAPSFVTGSLIARLGVLRVIALGGLLVLAAVAVNASGFAVARFGAGLMLLGIGWNFLFVGGSSLLTETHRVEERAKVQAAHDLLVFSTVALSAFSSGALYGTLGWRAVNLGVVAPVLAVLLALAWLAGRRKAEAAA